MQPIDGRPRLPVWALVVVLLAGWLLPLNPVHDAPRKASAQTLPDLGRLPLAFEPHVSSADASVRFMARAPGSLVLFAPSSVLIRLQTAPVQAPSEVAEAMPSSRTPTSGRVDGCAGLVGEGVRLNFLASRPTARVEPGARLPGRVNYFLGSDPSRWRTNIPTYAAITYRGIYPGVDLTYAGPDGRLKATFALAPGSDPGDVRWRYAGAAAPRVDEFGNLIVRMAPSSAADSFACAVPTFTLIEHAPVAWQVAGARRTPVSVGYVVADDGSIGFRVGTYDPARPLIIDPTLTYSSYLGGNSADYAYDVAVDAGGSAYVTGWTDSSDFPVASALQPTKNGFADVFLTKFTPAGTTLVYSTFLGGGLNDLGHSVAVDGAGNAYVSGSTDSNNFPVLNAIQPTRRGYEDAFVAKVNAAGSALVYSTYIGGSLPDGNYRVDIKADGDGNAYVAGNTSSTNFPVLDAIQPTYGGPDSDAFVTKLSPTGALVYSTYLGGSTMAAGLGDYAYGIAVDGNGSAYVAGYTFSANFPTKNPIQPSNAGNYDAFIAKISSGTGTGCTGAGATRLSGRVRTSAGATVPGVTMTLTGANCTSTTTTNARGSYVFAGLANGTYTVAPGKPGCSFTPPSQTVTISGGNVVATFTATCP